MTKLCKKCRSLLAIEEFYRHGCMADGRLNFCKACVRERVSSHRNRNLDAIRNYDRQRGKTQERLARVRQYAKTHPEVSRRGKDAWTSRNPHKKKAVESVNNAVRDKRLVRLPCEVCGAPKVEGHHDDYSKPLEVRWLCDFHHKQHHNRVREFARAA